MVTQIINKVEKENFGLKLKIHFLEESLRKAGPGFNEAALRENTDLKVDKITMQKELVRAKKTLSQAERDLEAYHLHLQGVQEDLKRKHVDKGLREELESLRSKVTSKEIEVRELHQKLEIADNNVGALEKCREDIEELEADLREKDRLTEERDEENDRLKAQARKDSEELEEIYEELEAGKRQIEDLEERQNSSTEQAAKLEATQKELDHVRNNLQHLQDTVQRAEATARTAKVDFEEAFASKQKAEDDLDEVRLFR
jgi:chromosome segregation ATPase